ncbi:hypothetical protein [Paenibacillus abyssi]|uniref:Transposase IS4-like domain-containing protein n=1 Tax=Paenibacillus abyssi TaxID=1340531 RepID=A0A917FTA2_9BACL|nr:hypothetical protein [Paenibacillus abyssi]GGF99657.1 hypothetical protein GCM10010916_16130 [Paenibacillus abyssi]
MIISDAGYGSEENDAYMETENVTAIVKYNTYHKEHTCAWKTDIRKIDVCTNRKAYSAKSTRN